MKQFLIPSIALIALVACKPQTPQAQFAPSEQPQYITSTDGSIPAGAQIARDADGNPLLGANGQPMYLLPSQTGQIEDNPNEIVLSDYTQEEQARDRAAYAQRLQAIAAQRVEVTSVDVPTPTYSVNVVGYARAATHPVGSRIFSRNGNRGSCAFRSPYEAQRVFLENGGPDRDTRGLDPDGDGFACKFDPTPYRNLY